MKQKAILAALMISSGGVMATESEGTYEIVALDSADFPRYGGGWNPGSGAEVEFSGWKFFREGGEILEGDDEVFSIPEASSVSNNGIHGNARFFWVKSKGDTPSYAQRNLNQKLWTDDMLSVTLLLPRTNGAAGMVVGRREGDQGALGAVAVVRDGGRLLLLDGEGEREIDITPSDYPIGISLVFSDDGAYTLQVNEVKKGGEKVDIGPRKPRAGGGPGFYTVGFFAKGGAEIGFDVLQVERIVK